MSTNMLPNNRANTHVTQSAGDSDAAPSQIKGSAPTAIKSHTRRIRLLLCFTGSVASVKAIPLCEQLIATKQYDIRICLSARAKAFIDVPALHQLMSAQNSSSNGTDGVNNDNSSFVYTDEDEWRSYKRGDPVLHIELRKWADILVIAPLSANSLAKLATGLADNLVTCVARAWDIQACKAQLKAVLVAPAMNTMMYVHPVTQQHLRTLQADYGYTLIDPISKMLACGDIGIGAMASVDEIVRVIEHKCRGVDVSRTEDTTPAAALQSLTLTSAPAPSPLLSTPPSRFFQLSGLQSQHRLLVIGDVHGCIDELRELVQPAKIDPQHHIVLSVGDLISKDKQAKAEKTAASLAVIDFCMQHGVLVAAGNHESKLLRCAAKLGRLQKLTPSISDSLAALPSYQRHKFPTLTHDYMYHAEATTNRHWRNEPITSQHYAIAEAMNDLQLAWVASLPLIIDFSTRPPPTASTDAPVATHYRICHAGQKPNTPLLHQTADNTTLLRTVHSIDNVTNMENGTASQSDSLVPWATKWQPVNARTGQPQPFILFGHDARLQLQVHQHAIGLDTGCCYGYALTGLVLPERRLVQVKAQRAYEKEDPMKPEFKRLLDSYAAFARLDVQVAQQMISHYLEQAG